MLPCMICSEAFNDPSGGVSCQLDPELQRPEVPLCREARMLYKCVCKE